MPPIMLQHAYRLYGFPYPHLIGNQRPASATDYELYPFKLKRSQNSPQRVVDVHFCLVTFSSQLLHVIQKRFDPFESKNNINNGRTLTYAVEQWIRVLNLYYAECRTA